MFTASTQGAQLLHLIADRNMAHENTNNANRMDFYFRQLLLSNYFGFIVTRAHFPSFSSLSYRFLSLPNWSEFSKLNCQGDFNGMDWITNAIWCYSCYIWIFFRFFFSLFDHLNFPLLLDVNIRIQLSISRPVTHAYKHASPCTKFTHSHTLLADGYHARVYCAIVLHSSDTPTGWWQRKKE